MLIKCYAVDKDSLRCYICYRADQRWAALRNHWSKILEIPKKNFYKSSPDKRTIGKPTKKKEYMGVCVISCKGTVTQQELGIIPKVILKGL